jgi:hypothetical protein
MEPGDPIDDAIDTAIEHTRDAQDRVAAKLDRGVVDADDAAVVAWRADDLKQLADDGADLADADLADAERVIGRDAGDEA